MNKQKDYTPKGYVDLDLEWLSPDEIIVARAKENKEWKVGPVPTMFTALYIINLETAEQKQLTFPKNNNIDNTPQVVDSTITWYRTSEKEKQGDVWVKDSIDGLEQLWLKKCRLCTNFFL